MSIVSKVMFAVAVVGAVLCAMMVKSVLTDTLSNLTF